MISTATAGGYLSRPTMPGTGPLFWRGASGSWSTTCQACQRRRWMPAPEFEAISGQVEESAATEKIRVFCIWFLRKCEKHVCRILFIVIPPVWSKTSLASNGRFLARQMSVLFHLSETTVFRKNKYGPSIFLQQKPDPLIRYQVKKKKHVVFTFWISKGLE